MSNNPENTPNNPELTANSAESAAEQLEKLSKSPENSVELSPRDAEAMTERARVEALESAVSVEAGGAEKKIKRDLPKNHQGPVGKKQKAASFKRQMSEVQSQMSPTEKTFSKIIHNKAVEKTSDVVGATIARPNAILAGAVFAFIFTLAVYLIAKNIGYKLSGFETILAFCTGWIVGILYDYLRLIITGKK
jgi:hypothetical protein